MPLGTGVRNQMGMKAHLASGEFYYRGFIEGPYFSNMRFLFFLFVPRLAQCEGICDERAERMEVG